MTPLQAMGSILPLAVTSGINLYLTMLIVGLSIRFDWVPVAPPGLEVLATIPVLVVVGVFYILEFFADKIAFVDNVWDLVHTFVRPVGAAVIATASLTGIDPELVDAAAGITGVGPDVGLVTVLTAGTAALITHGGKAGTRTVVNVVSPAETFTNIIISLAEDLLVALIVFLALRYPLMANIVSVTLLVAILIFVPQLLRWAWFTLRAVSAALKSMVHQVRRSDVLPAHYLALLPDRTPVLVSHALAQNVRRANGRRGFLVLLDDTLCFTYTAWFRRRVWCLDRQQMGEVTMQRHALLHVLEVPYRDEAGMPHIARFAFTRDRGPLVEQFVSQMAAAQPA